MPDFNEQLETIARLRSEARQHDEALYGARVRSQKLKQRLARAKQQMTIQAPDQQTEIARLRAEMARVNQQLAALREQAGEVTRALEKIAEQRRIVEHLKQSLTALRNRLEALKRRLDELEQDQPPPEDEIARVRAESESLQNSQAQLEEALRAATAQLDQLSREERALRDRLSATHERMDGLRADLAGLQGRITDSSQPVFDDRQAIDANIAELHATAERSSAAGSRLKGEISSQLGGLYAQDPHPRRTLALLDDRTPFLLFPVRIETIFADNELRVRIFPDEIAVHTHEATLTDREVDAGQLYWTELVTAAHLKTERDRRQRAAWTQMVDLLGGQRAAYVAKSTKPADWDTLAGAGETQSLIAFLSAADAGFFASLEALPLTPQMRVALKETVDDEDGDAFCRLAEQQAWGERINTAVRGEIDSFPVIDVTKTDAWSRAPRTRVLPDRFVLLLHPSETSAPREIPGALIPDTVILGPDPLDPAKFLVEKDNARVPGGDSAWLSDFDLAVAQGLGFRVALSEQEAVNGFARVAVLGLRLSTGANDSAAMLEELITNHQCAPSGFSLVPQGTPTNNTERNGTGYSDNDPYDDLAFFTELDPPAFDAASPSPLKSQTDGRLLADALGISYSTLERVQHADQRDILEARSMNAALFPSTLGYWLKTWMGPVVTPTAARITRSFFDQHVTGRGPLPAIRVGNQPYGVLLTSDLSRWKYRELQGAQLAILPMFDELTPYLANLHRILSALQSHWSALAADLLSVGKPGTDSSDVLMNVLGLHPTSVEFYQRIGFHEQYLCSLGDFIRPGAYRNELESLRRSLPASLRRYLVDTLGVATDDGEVAKTRATHVLWQHYLSSLDVPSLVENRPPSEVATLAVNYIDWLAKAPDTAQIINESFPGTKPAALLYVMLRNALLLQLHNGTYDWLKERSTFEPALETSINTVAIAGVRASVPAVSRLELMAVPVNAVQADHPVPTMRVADWIWSGPVAADTEAAFVKEQRAALEVLARSNTASLERCLVEHLDCCQYRLDAWQTGLISQRLQSQRNASSDGEHRTTGIYLGAYGWVENLRRTPRTTLRPEGLPPTLRPKDNGPVLEEDEIAAATRTQGGLKQGGYVHAPSMNHAAASALLRSAYLSHASSAQAEMLSVNLSSGRVRRAQFVLEGMRNGQPIEALLGYQFERGLHDRTSTSAALNEVPVLELNQFIEPYRTAFPLDSREIPQAGTGPATETVPPFSVVNGLKLTTAALNAANGFGLSAVLPSAGWPDANHGAAILAERDSLLEALDAVKDLLMAENAFQLVQGNFDRVAAVSLAQKDARVPNSLEVLDTPRGTQFTFTNRVTLHFDDLDPTLAASNPWSAVNMTPRALTEPGVNFWLGEVLGGSPEDVSCEIWRVVKAADGTETRADIRAVTLADLQLQPIDFIALAGINSADAQGATELETRVARQYRRANGIAMSDVVRIGFDPVVAAGKQTFGTLLPLARRLRSLLGDCRALGAQDFLPSAGGKATAIAVDKTNPGGYDAAELLARVNSALASLTALADSLDGPAAPGIDLLFTHDPDNAGDDEPFAGALGDAFAKLDEVGADFTDTTEVQTTFSLLDAEALHATLRAISYFGISDSFPPEADLTSDAARLSLLSRARRVARRLRRAQPKDGVLDRAGAFIAAATPDHTVAEQVTSLLQAGRTLFAETLQYLPQFNCYNEVDLSASDAARAQLLAHALSVAPGIGTADLVDEWLQGLARVRPRMQTWEVVRALSDALNDSTLDMRPVQVPFRDKDSWLAAEFPEKDPIDPTKPFGISRDTLSITAHGRSAFKAGAAQRGVLLDEWTEEIPTASENTGISFRFNQPNAVPPQALLLAVTPEETGSWNWDHLVGTLNDTLARAKRRAVEPAQLEKNGLIWNAIPPALVSEFSTIDKADVSLDLLVALEFTAIHEFYAAAPKS